MWFLKTILRNLIQLITIIYIVTHTILLSADGSEKTVNKIRIVVFPLVNLSGSYLAEEKVMRVLTLSLLESGEFELVDPLSVEKFMERERIRRTDMISTALARKLKEEFGIIAVLVGSVDLYDSGENPKVGINLTMINLITSEIIWGSSVSYTSEDFKGIFGLGKASSVFDLTQIIVEEMVASMPDDFTMETTGEGLTLMNIN